MWLRPRNRRNISRDDHLPLNYRWENLAPGCPPRRREGGRVVKTAITGTARDILLPLCGHHPEFVFTYHIPGGPAPIG